MSKQKLTTQGEKEYQEYLSSINERSKEEETKDESGWQEIKVLTPTNDNADDPIITVWYIYRNEPGQRGQLYAVTNDENKILLFVRERDMNYFFIQRFRMLKSEYIKEFTKNPIALKRTAISVSSKRVSILRPSGNFYDIEVEMPKKSVDKLKAQKSNEDLIMTHRFNKRYLKAKMNGFKRLGTIIFNIDKYNENITEGESTHGKEKVVN